MEEGRQEGKKNEESYGTTMPTCPLPRKVFKATDKFS
jgi:hypothetical protein